MTAYTARGNKTELHRFSLTLTSIYSERCTVSIMRQIIPCYTLSSFSLIFAYNLSGYLKNRCCQNHQTWHKNVPPWLLETHLFWDQKAKGQGREAQNSTGMGYGVLHSFECWLLLYSHLLHGVCPVVQLTVSLEWQWRHHCRQRSSSWCWCQRRQCRHLHLLVSAAALRRAQSTIVISVSTIYCPATALKVPHSYTPTNPRRWNVVYSNCSVL